MLTKVVFKNGTVKEISSKIAYDREHQISLGFTVMEGQEMPEVEKKSQSFPNEQKPAAEKVKRKYTRKVTN